MTTDADTPRVISDLPRLSVSEPPKPEGLFDNSCRIHRLPRLAHLRRCIRRTVQGRRMLSGNDAPPASLA
jgi:hypothetical protein